MKNINIMQGVKMKTVTTAAESADRQARFEQIQPHYLEALKVAPDAG